MHNSELPFSQRRWYRGENSQSSDLPGQLEVKQLSPVFGLCCEAATLQQ